MTRATNDNEPQEAREFASPPCLMHRLDPVSGSLMAEADSQQRTDVTRWRKAERDRRPIWIVDGLPLFSPFEILARSTVPGKARSQTGSGASART